MARVRIELDEVRDAKMRRVDDGDRVCEAGEGDVQLIAVRRDRQVRYRSEERR